MSQVRPLVPADKASIELVLASRSATIGVSWTGQAIVDELATASSLGLFKEKQLEAIVLYKDMGAVLEILLIFSKKGVPQSGFLILDALTAAHSQAREIWLEVHEDNTTARVFYERHGFTSQSARRGYYPDGKQAINYNLIVSRDPG